MIIDRSVFGAAALTPPVDVLFDCSGRFSPPSLSRHRAAQ